MAVAVQGPQRRQEEDPLDRIAKGLSIASSIFGIKEAGDKAQFLAEQRAQEAKNQQFSQAAKEAELTGQGYEKTTDENGNVTFNLAQGVKELRDRKQLAEVKKAEYDARGGGTKGLDEALKKLQLDEAMRKAKEAREAPSKDASAEIEKLTTGISNRTMIKADIESALAQLQSPDIDDDHKVQIGNELIKTLNSTQGADAVGEGEAKRLAGYLTYHYFNLTDPGAFHGRDLPGFVDQVKLNRDRLDNTVTELRGKVDVLKGKPEVEPDLQKAAQQELMKRKGLKAAQFPGK